MRPVIALAATILSIASPLGFAQDPPPADPPPPVPAPPAPPAVETPDPDSTVPIVIEARGLKPTPPPLFFSASSQSAVAINAKGWTATINVDLRALQGKAEVLTLAIHGGGQVTSVTGEGIAAWAVAQRVEGKVAKRFLEIRPALDANGEPLRELKAVVTAEQRDIKLPAEAKILTLGAGKAVGFSSLVTVTADTSVDVKVAKASGLVPVDAGAGADRTWKFQSFGQGELALTLTPGGAARAPVELRNVSITGTVDESGRSASLVLSGEAVVTAEDGGRIDVLSGHAAVSELPAGGAFSLRLAPRPKGGPVYQLVFDKAGTVPVRFAFQAGLSEADGRFTIDFTAPAGAVVPIELSGLAAETEFDPACAVFPLQKDDKWAGFLPGDGRSQIAWQTAREAGEGKLFFASDALIETRVGAGLLRQTTSLQLGVLQGKLDAVTLLLEGAGEILAVEGGNVLGWSIAEGEGGKRELAVELAQPATGTEKITVRSQSPLGDFPLDVSPMRLTPQGAVRHSGYLRVSNYGAVRLEVGGVKGLTQLAPEQYPGGGAPGGARQVFVYRFPSAAHSYQIHADQILPEVGVSQILVYEMTDTDRVIGGQVELDIREAPLREWGMRIPEGYAVVAVSGAEVADYVVGTEVQEGSRSLKVLFRSAVAGRQLVRFRLEKNVAAAAGLWTLPPLTYPEAKSVRGHVGVATAPGFRVVPGELENLAELPMAYFPAKVDGLQQAYRLREGDWSASFDVVALAQSVQADVFHLYSLKEGIAYGSVLINYFVVGAPVGEWRLEVPEAVGNLAVEGQNVQGWRRDAEAGQVVVTLHQPTLGAATLLLTFEQPMSARGGVLHPGEVKPVGVQGERGFIQVVSPSQVRHEISKATPGLLKMEALELPAEFRLLTTSPSLAVYQYSARPFELGIDIEWFKAGETVDQMVDFAKLHSRVSGDGEIVTNAQFYVRTRGRKALRMSLPEGADLWLAQVNGERVNARSDGSETLIPLPASIDPNTPVEISISLGQTSDDARRPKISAPALSAASVISTWVVDGDPDRRLVPEGGKTPQLADQVQTETGFEWLAAQGGALLLVLLALALIGVALVRSGGRASATLYVGTGLAIAAVVLSLVAAEKSGRERSVGKSQLEFVAPVVSEGESVTLELRNVAAWETLISWPGVVLSILGLCLVAGAPFGPSNYRRWLTAGGLVLLFGGLLAQRGGAMPFFIALAVFVYVAGVHPGLRAAVKLLQERAARLKAEQDAEREAAKKAVAKKKKRARKKADDGGGGTGPAPGGATSLLLLGGLAAAIAGAPGGATLHAADAPAPLLADTSVQSLRIEDGRLYGELDLQISGRENDTLLLLRSPAILTKFAGDGLRVSKRGAGGKVDYWLVVEKAGPIAAKVSYELALPTPEKAFNLPTATAAVQRVDVRYEKPGWEITSPAAVKTGPLPGLADGQSGARMVLGPNGAASIQLKPLSRDIAAEQAKFFAEVANLFIPAPGLVDGRHKITVRPSRGQVRSLAFGVPEGFTVSEVAGDGVTTWRFDPESKSLAVELSPPKSQPFSLVVETQQGTDTLPATASLAPLVVRGAANQIGTLAVAFGSDAQPEKIEPAGLSKVNLDDFDASLLPVNKEGAPLVALHQAFRYGAEPGSLTVTAGPVQPEVRVATQQTLSVGSERLVLAVDLVANITRAGLFKLSFPLDEGLEVEAASGDALSHWTESKQEGGRVITLHLNGRTLGAQKFAISLAGPAPGEQKEWVVPRFSIREATRQTGQLLVVPEQGIRAASLSRQHVSQLDARKLSGGRAGTLAFRLLQADWQLKLELENLETWVTAEALQEVTLREGLTATRLSVRFQVENAAVKTLRLRLPGLTADEERTVRASGEGVTDIVKVQAEGEGEEPGPADLWEIRFSRRILGGANVEIDYQRAADRQGVADGNGEVENVRTAVFDGVRQAAYWVAVRVSGHLEITVGETARGWSRVDWTAIPRGLQDRRDRSMPAFAFRAVDPEGALKVGVRRHAIAEDQRLRVGRGKFTTVFAPDGASVTEAEMQVEVDENSAMEIRLPEGATLLGAFVNNESVGIVSEGDAYRFYVGPLGESGSATVSLSWALAGSGKRGRNLELDGPRLNVPLLNVTWEVIVPEGYTLLRADGTLDLVEEEETERRDYDFAHYKASVLQRRNVLANEGKDSLEKGLQWRAAGDQKKALSELGRATRNTALAPAANEDARVQLRELQTEQAIVGLNTRRQKLYLDNAGDATVVQNQQLEQAAERNPLLQGQINYNPQEVNNLLSGNTAEETAALRRIAARLVGQQLAAEPALQAIDVPVQGRGEVLTFKRSIQVKGDSPLAIELRFAPERRSSPALGLLVLIVIAGAALLCFWRRGEEKTEEAA